jgi:hypothetical protein
MTPAGSSASTTSILILGWVHASPELSEGRPIIQQDLADIPDERTHVGYINLLVSVNVAITDERAAGRRR